MLSLSIDGILFFPFNEAMVQAETNHSTSLEPLSSINSPSYIHPSVIPRSSGSYCKRWSYVDVHIDFVPSQINKIAAYVTSENALHQRHRKSLAGKCQRAMPYISLPAKRPLPSDIVNPEFRDLVDLAFHRVSWTLGPSRFITHSSKRCLGNTFTHDDWFYS